MANTINNSMQKKQIEILIIYKYGTTGLSSFTKFDYGYFTNIFLTTSTHSR